MTTSGAARSPSGDASAGVDNLVLRLASQPEEVAPARHAVHDYLVARDVPPAMADDIRLVASELVTNGILHGREGWIGVEVDLAPRASVSLRVTNEGPVGKIPPVTRWRPADLLSVGGRGLGIVRRLVDDVEVQGDDDRATVICRWRWGGGT